MAQIGPDRLLGMMSSSHYCGTGEQSAGDDPGQFVPYRVTLSRKRVPGWVHQGTVLQGKPAGLDTTTERVGQFTKISTYPDEGSITLPFDQLNVVQGAPPHYLHGQGQ